MIFQQKTKPHGIQRYDEFIIDGKIGIGWPGIGNLSKIKKYELRNRLEDVYKLHGAKLGNALGAVWSFIHVMDEGNIILIRRGSKVSIGKIGDYFYEDKFDNRIDGFCHQRTVEWIVIEENLNLFNDKLRETVNHRGIVTKSKYDMQELELNKI